MCTTLKYLLIFNGITNISISIKCPFFSEHVYVYNWYSPACKKKKLIYSTE